MGSNLRKAQAALAQRDAAKRAASNPNPKLVDGNLAKARAENWRTPNGKQSPRS
jgi:hypothetical protein